MERSMVDAIRLSPEDLPHAATQHTKVQEDAGTTSSLS